MPSRNIFNRFLSSTGLTGGTKDMATTADEYYILAVDETLEIHQLIVAYQDGNGGTATEYANLNAALATGIEIKIIGRDGSTVKQDLTDGVPITTNGEWHRAFFEHTSFTHGGGEDVFAYRWNFARSEQAIILEPGQRLSMFINDDLSLVTWQYALVQGHVFD